MKLNHEIISQTYKSETTQSRERKREHVEIYNSSPDVSTKTKTQKLLHLDLSCQFGISNCGILVLGTNDPAVTIKAF